jgi:CheY-like chemotaxis protein
VKVLADDMPATAPADTAAAPADTAAAPAEATIPAPAAPEASPQDRQLRNDVDAYFHYAWIGRYDLAGQFAQKVTDETTDPAALIPVLEDIAKLHDPNTGYLSQLLLFDNQPELKDATDKLLLKVQAGNVARAQDPALIEETIRDMSAGERAYENHLPYLRRSGELAVPIMIQFLRLPDDQHLPYRGTARRALADMGRVAVNPLLAAMAMKDNDTLLTIIDTLGSLGYDEAGPYLAVVANDSSAPEAVRNAATSALGRLGISPIQAADPAGMYYQLALRFYYGKADIAQVIDNPGASAATPVRTCNYWNWDADKGLARVEVPAEIFADLMTLRSCEESLRLAPNASAEAVALWLDADNKREADLPDGAADPVRGDQPPAHYFNVSSGAKHLDDALARSLKDRNAAVSLKLTHSLSQIVGRVSMDGRLGDPLTEALRFPDKRVRYEAALALARALPSKSFSNQELVVPLLVEAIGAGGGGNLLVLGPNRDDANALAQTLRSLGYVSAAAASPGEAVSAAAGLPSVDAIVIARGVSDDDINRMISLVGQAPKLADSVEVALKESNTGSAAALALSNPSFTVTTEADGDGLKKAIDDARAKAGLGALEQQQADAYAMDATQVLEKLAITQNAVLNASGAETGLLSALDGPKADLVAAVGHVVACLPSNTAQQGLAQRALNDQTPAPVRISLFESLAASAKAFGNQLNGPQVVLLQKEAVEIKETGLRSAAAEARGALNLPTDQARDLILGESGPSSD